MQRNSGRGGMKKAPSGPACLASRCLAVTHPFQQPDQFVPGEVLRFASEPGNQFVAPTHIALTTQILFLRSSMGNIALNCNRIQSHFSTEPPKNIKRIVERVGDAPDTPGQD